MRRLPLVPPQVVTSHSSQEGSHRGVSGGQTLRIVRQPDREPHLGVQVVVRIERGHELVAATIERLGPGVDLDEPVSRFGGYVPASTRSPAAPPRHDVVVSRSFPWPFDDGRRRPVPAVGQK